jgi:probable rRNA maturation factor
MRLLNYQYRGIDRTTDVLSFPQEESISLKNLNLMKNVILGDIVISVPKAKKQAKENGLTFYEEIKRLLIHGVLHLIGYDHENNNKDFREMQKITNKLINQTEDI